MLKNLYILSEGRTECYFIKYVLSEHLLDYGWIVVPITLPTGRKITGGHKGGWRRSDGYKYALEEIRKEIITHTGSLHTTFFDLYGFPKDIPCYEQAKSLSSPYDKAQLYELQIKQDISSLFADDDRYNSNLFLPYVQPYEFESFLFVDAKSSAAVLFERNEKKATWLEKEISRIAAEFETPEHINGSSDTAPSKRIEKLVPGFEKNKAGKAGFSWKAPQRVGTQSLRQACQHFNKWLSSLESYSNHIT